jgi:hypothetical protein
VSKEKTEPATGQTSGEIDARMYKLMYELDRRLDDKFREARIQNKEDIKVATELAISPVYGRLDNIDRRLDEGNKKFDDQDSRASDHSDRIDNALEIVRKHKENCPLKNQESQAPVTRKTNKQPSWWLVLLAGGALAFLGERATRLFINGMADPPPQAIQAKP